MSCAEAFVTVIRWPPNCNNQLMWLQFDLWTTENQAIKIFRREQGLNRTDSLLKWISLPACQCATSQSASLYLRLRWAWPFLPLKMVAVSVQFCFMCKVYPQSLQWPSVVIRRAHWRLSSGVLISIMTSFWPMFWMIRTANYVTVIAECSPLSLRSLLQCLQSRVHGHL